MTGTSLERKWDVHFCETSRNLRVGCRREWSKSKNGGENTGAKLRHRKCDHGGFSLGEGVLSNRLHLLRRNRPAKRATIVEIIFCVIPEKVHRYSGVDTVDWLLDSDPAIRWQAMRDLTDASPAEIAAERARIPHQGLGAEILGCQESNGSWRRADAPVWLPTLFTLLLLRATGVDRAEPAVDSAVAASRRAWAGTIRRETGNCVSRNWAESRSSMAKWSRASTEACLRLGVILDARVGALRAA